MRKLSVATTALVSVVVLMTSAALASPPSGQFSFQDHGRGQTAEPATFTIPTGTDTLLASYTLSPGGDSGWRASPGSTLLVVTRGTLTLRRAPDCAARDYPAGQAAVVSADRYRLTNAGSEPVEFSGGLTNLAADGGNPFVDGAPAPAPAGCAVTAQSAGDGSPLTVSRLVRGTAVPVPAHGGHHGSAYGGDSIAVQAGRDVFVTSYEFQPGFSSGWFDHAPTLAIATRGTITYYEGRDGQCVKEEYRPGQAYLHEQDGPHTHMLVNEGNEPSAFILAFFNVRHGNPYPVLGNTPDAADFSKLPPSECPRLR